MNWTGPNLSFWLITAVVLTSASFAAFSKSITRAAFNLFFTLSGMAGYYILLGSDFVAVTQVIIYVGGILVLLMFGVLLTNRTSPDHAPRLVNSMPAAIVTGLFFVLILVPVVLMTPWMMASDLAEPVSSTAALGKLLLGNYSLVLLLSGMTLLLCLVGAAFLVRRRD